jgi:hypothetical protein
VKSGDITYIFNNVMEMNGIREPGKKLAKLKLEALFFLIPRVFFLIHLDKL